MASAWADFLDAPTACSHAAQIYADIDELAESVAPYLAAGFTAGEPALLVATPAHRRVFAAWLGGWNWDVETLRARGMLTVLDADTMLGRLMHAGGGPSATVFEAVIGEAVDGIGERFPNRTIRIFGEMVDLLSERGHIDEAIRLEELWNGLARTRRFSLLCGYRLDVFDLATQRTPLPHVCRVHSHVLPVPDPQRLAHAVDLALDEVLGTERTAQVHTAIAETDADKVPRAQHALMWVSANMPTVSDRILARARSHYTAPPASVAT